MVCDARFNWTIPINASAEGRLTAIDLQHGWNYLAHDYLRQAGKVRMIVQAPATAILHLYETDGAPLAVLMIRATWIGSAASAPSNRGPVDALGPARGGPWREVNNEAEPGDELVLQYGGSGGMSVRREKGGAVLNVYEL